jgi:hypothetical protein
MTKTRIGLMAFICIGLYGAVASGYALDHMRISDDIGLNKAPRFGESHILVIPSRIDSEFSPAQWDAYVEFFSSEGGEGTFRQYWQTVSGGLYDPIPTLVNPVIYSECPIPGRTLTNCRIDITDFELLTEGYVRIVLTDLIERVRDEQSINLMDFDVNGANCSADANCPDGFFDGVIIDTDMYAGVGFPLGALNNTVTVRAFPQPLAADGGMGMGSSADAGAAPDSGPSQGNLDGGTPVQSPADAGLLDAGLLDAGLLDAGALDELLGPEIQLGVVALIPPENHEFGHNLGFIDLYNGPTLNGLMATSDSSLSAFSRLQAGWGEAQTVTEPGVFQLAPVYEGGTILAFGQAPRYVLLENRGGALHDEVDESYPGLHLYSVDEGQLPTEELGFIDVIEGTLYYPNENGPYLNVSMPLDCQIVGPTQASPCAFGGVGDLRDIEHASDGHLDFHIEVQSVAEDGTIQIEVRPGEREAPLPPEEDAGTQDEDAGPDSADGGTSGEVDNPEDCSCTQSAGTSGVPAGLLCCLGALFSVIRKRRRRQ